jgi:hypothetical protein
MRGSRKLLRASSMRDASRDGLSIEAAAGECRLVLSANDAFQIWSSIPTTSNGMAVAGKGQNEDADRPRLHRNLVPV